MDEEQFLISFDADTNKLDNKIRQVQNKLDNMADTVIVDFDATDANNSLGKATSTMNAFKKQTIDTKKETSLLNAVFDKVNKSLNSTIGETTKASNIMSKFAKVKEKINKTGIDSTLGKRIRKSVGNAYTNLVGENTAKGMREYQKGIAPLRHMPYFLKEDWQLKTKLKSGIATAFNMPNLAENIRESANPKPEDLSPTEALNRFKGISKSLTYSTIFEDIFGSLTDNRARASILNKVFIAAKDGLTKYNDELKILEANMNEIYKSRFIHWMDTEGKDQFGDLEDYKKYIEERQKLLKQSAVSEKMFNLSQKGPDAINTEIAKVSAQMEDLNKKRREGLADKTLDKDSAKYKEIVNQIKEYKKELFELQSLKANNGEFYEIAASNIPTLRHKAKSSGEIMTINKNAIEESARLNKEYEDVVAKIEESNKQLSIFQTVAAKIKAEIRAIIMDLQKNPTKELWSSDTLKSFSKMWKDMTARFSKDNPATKMMTAFTRLGARIKQQTISIFANWLNPIYVLQRGISGFFAQNIRYANTFKVVAYNAISLLEKVVKNLLDWSLKGLQYINIFTKTWAGVDLFDKSAASAKKMKNELKDVTASFDELHAVNSSEPFGITLMDTGELPDINKEFARTLQNFANRFKDTMQDIGNWLAEKFKHPIKSLLQGWLFLETIKLLKTIFGQSLLNIGKAGFSNLFKWAKLGLSNLFSAGSIFTMGFKGAGFLTWLNTIISTIGVVISVWDSFKTGLHLGKNWNELTTLEKILSGVKIAIDAVSTGFFTFMLTKNPFVAVIAAIGSVLLSLGAAFLTAHTGIESLDKEIKKHKQAVEEAKQAEQDWQDSMVTLRELEEQYGQSGKAVYDMIQNGTMAYEDLTSAQMRLYNVYEDVIQLEETKVKEAHEATMAALNEQVAAINSNKSTWEEWLNSFNIVVDNGSLSAEELATAYEKAFAEADASGRKYLQENIPESIEKLADVDRYKGTFDGFTNFIKTWWNNIKKIFTGGKIKIGYETDVESLKGNYTQRSTNTFGVSSYAVGTNYIPNDQLALVHKGEAIIPEKYNSYNGKQGTPYSPNNASNSALQYAIETLTSTTRALKQSVDAGINVTGEFKQRGSDLYATVEKAKSRRGVNTLSDVSYAR